MPSGIILPLGEKEKEEGKDEEGARRWIGGRRNLPLFLEQSALEVKKEEEGELMERGRQPTEQRQFF